MELCLWKYRMRCLNVFCYLETARDWLLRNLLPWLLPIILGADFYSGVTWLFPYLWKALSLRDWFIEKRFCLTRPSSFDSGPVCFSLNSAYLSAASLVKLWLTAFCLLLSIDWLGCLTKGSFGAIFYSEGDWATFVFCFALGDLSWETMIGAILGDDYFFLGWTGAWTLTLTGSSDWSVLLEYREVLLWELGRAIRGPWLLCTDMINNINNLS